MTVAAFMAAGAEGSSGGSGGGSSAYVDDNFKVVTWVGTGSARTIETGGLTGLNTDGCMIWVMSRSTITNSIFDTLMGAGNYLNPTTTANPTADATTLTAFTSTGFSIGTSARVNNSGTQYFAYVFKKTPTAIMDIATGTGTGSGSFSISHGLGASPGMIILKRTSGTAQNWYVWHQSSPGKALYLNVADNGITDANLFPSVGTTSFTVGSTINTAAGATYVAYVFPTNSNVVCSSYTGNGNANGPTVNVGFEPGFILTKAANTGAGTYWTFMDKWRHLPTTLSSSGTTHPQYLSPNSGEGNYVGFGTNQAGFKVFDSGAGFNLNFNTVQYNFMAIRQTNKPAAEQAATSFFSTSRNVATSNTTPRSEFYSNIGFNPDMLLAKHVSAAANPYVVNRDETNPNGSISHYRNITSSAQVNDSGGPYFDRHHALTYGGAASANLLQGYFFKKTVGFFDMIDYTGNGTSSQTVAHNLGAVPELMIIKALSADDWNVYWASLGTNSRMLLNSNAAAATGVSSWASTTPTATNFYVGDTTAAPGTNVNGTLYHAYLFASVAGKVKIGTYTGNGAANQDIDCGFSTGARFVLITPTNAAYNWYVTDTIQGINAGADGYWAAQAAAAMISTGTGIDLIDPYSTGFSVTNITSGLNTNSVTYAYMAIA